MSFCITPVQDDVCFRGAMRSILNDSQLDYSKRSDIMQLVNQRTQGNVTSIFPSSSNPNQDFGTVFQNYINIITCKTNIPTFQLKFELQMVNIEGDMFCLLFWEGNQLGSNQHVTRFCGMQNDKVLLMDPAIGKICCFSLAELSALSPKGFSIIVFKFK